MEMLIKTQQKFSQNNSHLTIRLVNFGTIVNHIRFFKIDQNYLLAPKDAYMGPSNNAD